MRELAVGRSNIALIDDEDYERAVRLSWCLTTIRGAKHVYRYARARLGGRKVSLHRFILDAPRGADVDHINGDGLDNRRLNLRACSHAQNMANKRPSTGKYKGVSRSRRRWRAEIAKGGKRVSLGSYATEREAAVAYDAAARQLHGGYAWLNFPD